MSVRKALVDFMQKDVGPNDMVGIMYPLQPVASVRFTRHHEAIAKAIQQSKGRKFAYTPRNQSEEQYANYPTEVVERIRCEVPHNMRLSLSYPARWITSELRGIGRSHITNLTACGRQQRRFGIYWNYEHGLKKAHWFLAKRLRQSNRIQPKSAMALKRSK